MNNSKDSWTATSRRLDEQEEKLQAERMKGSGKVPNEAKISWGCAFLILIYVTLGFVAIYVMLPAFDCASEGDVESYKSFGEPVERCGSYVRE